MRLPVNEYLRSVVKQFVTSAEQGRPSEAEDPAFGHVLPDVIHFHRQLEELTKSGIPQSVAVFYDHDDVQRTQEIEVPIYAPDISNIAISYTEVLNLLNRSGLRVRNRMDAQQIQGIFIERLSEFMAQMFVSRSAVAGGGMVFTKANTFVDSNRQNDTILYAKGYFASTGVALGVSSPAQGYIMPGRYSFGIMDSGTARYEPVLWSCPTRVRLNLP